MYEHVVPAAVAALEGCSTQLVEVRIGDKFWDVRRATAALVICGRTKQQMAAHMEACGPAEDSSRNETDDA
ncbi:unnamed protein product [Toxocara canis]|uniref:tRNA_edit domain-containing protein n=1 Tax=Toxocara canis TaxID=6265 RepID=A0A183UNQ4_TOXCA|nr:unnamed protein product [Toxocara canis]